VSASDPQTTPTTSRTSGPLTTVPAPPGAGANGRVPPPARGRRRPRWQLLAGAAAVLLLLLMGVAIWRQTAGAPPPPAPTATPGPTFRSRGVIRPVAQARIGSAGGGSVSSLSVREGDTVQSHQEIARVSGPNGTEVLVAPWAGTITAVPVDRGATVAPGGAVATIGDLSRLRAETTDVDEYLVDQIRRGQAVLLRVDALDQRTIQGFVRTVALEPQPGSAGFEHYPVVIDLVEVPPELRVGMTVRVAFELPQAEPTTTPTPSP
jgi:multidrug efflux pump subunit AcrA (membrane-fusion protein)